MIEFRKVSKAFGSHRVLDQIDLRVNPGEIVFVIGKSGVGKSVLLKHIVGLLSPDSGEVWVDGKNVTAYSEAQFLEVRRNCGMVFQNPALLDSLTVFDNVAFGLRAQGKHRRTLNAEVEKRLAQVRLGAEAGSRFPSELSFGEQKRVAIARTLAVEPSYLLFDEPTTGLDPVTTRLLNRLIRNLAEELKVGALVVSHDMACAIEIADHILMIGEGRILDQGDVEHMKQSRVPLVREFLRDVLEGE